MAKNETLIYGILISAIFLLSFYLRGVLPYDSVFSTAYVRFGGNDPWYNMRLVDSTLYNFPDRIFYDAFTAYPIGKIVPFAPFFDYLLACIIWIIGMGDPYVTLGQHGIDAIGAWYPAILGALIVVPVYFIGAKLWNRVTGIFAALVITILPGPFFTRSLLGFTDHDVGGILVSTIAMLFVFLALKAAKKNEITFESVLKKDWQSLKKPLSYSLLAGISLGSFYLSWIGAPILMFIFIIYALFQHISIDHPTNKNTDYLSLVFVPIFVIALIMILPIPRIGDITRIQVISLVVGISTFLFLNRASDFFSKKKFEVYWYPITMLTGSVLFFIILSVVAPSLLAQVTEALSIFVPSASSLTVAEVHPMRVFGTSGAHPGAKEIFSTTFFIAFAGFACVGYNIWKKLKAEEILFLVWGAVMLFACFGQNRFAAYYAVNVALLCGVASCSAISRIGQPEIIVEKARVKGGFKKAKRKKPEKLFFKNASVIFATLIILLLVIVPPLQITITRAQHAGGIPQDWHDTLTWMEENTPDTGVDYYGLYEVPKINESTGHREKYVYPDTAYSIMSWWDYGHWITRIAHRIPVANPFQQGIGGSHQSTVHGASTFFTTNNEIEANAIADEFDVKYVVTDFMMADAFDAFYNKFGAMVVWSGDTDGYYTQIRTNGEYRVVPSAKYFGTMVARLHIFDGSSVMLNEDTYLEPLRHYRLVYESPSTILEFGGNEIKYVKVFEYVEGTAVAGIEMPNAIVELSTKITTNQGRVFTYSDIVVVNETGAYEFIVPYEEGETKGVVVEPFVVKNVNYK